MCTSFSAYQRGKCMPASSSKFSFDWGFYSAKNQCWGFCFPKDISTSSACTSCTTRRSKRWRSKLIPACTSIQPEHFASSMMNPGDQLNEEEGTSPHTDEVSRLSQPLL